MEDYKISQNKDIKHDRYLKELCCDLDKFYDEIQTNIPLFSKKNRRVTEIDILARKDNFYDVYEVKCSYRISKARKQLLKIKKLMPRVKNTYFYCGESKSIERIIG